MDLVAGHLVGDEGGGAETYAVAPVLSWARDEDGRPTVVDVERDAVRVGGE